MNKTGKRAQGQIESVTKEHKDKEDHGSYPRDGGHLGSDAIDDKAQDRTGYTQGEKADVAQDIAKESCNDIV